MLGLLSRRTSHLKKKIYKLAQTLSQTKISECLCQKRYGPAKIQLIDSSHVTAELANTRF